MGSPLRVRGKAFRVGLAGRILGITPAYAGKRRSAPAPTSKARDHPRACGEKRFLRERNFCFMGSPPRMRGKGMGCRTENPDPGITPAHAGKSDLLQPGCRRFEDHPRACGEKAVGKSGLCSYMGSPPRMRGKVGHRDRINAYPGITPAHAGKSFGFAGAVFGRWDHPRACGEKATASDLCPRLAGSPPRMRGKGGRGQGNAPHDGITPAHAGKRLPA